MGGRYTPSSKAFTMMLQQQPCLTGVCAPCARAFAPARPLRAQRQATTLRVRAEAGESNEAFEERIAALKRAKGQTPMGEGKKTASKNASPSKKVGGGWCKHSLMLESRLLQIEGMIVARPAWQLGQLSVLARPCTDLGTQARRGGFAAVVDWQRDGWGLVLHDLHTHVLAPPCPGGARTRALVCSHPPAAMQPTTTKQSVDYSTETLYLETPPAYGDLAVNVALGATLLWLPLTFAAIGRTAFVRYRFTDMRLSVVSDAPWKKEQLDAAYSEITDVRAIGRGVGAWGDMVFDLRSGDKVEMRAVPRWQELRDYVLARSKELRAAEDVGSSGSGPRGGGKGFLGPGGKGFA